MPSEKAIKAAVKSLKKRKLYPTPHRIAKILDCLVSDLPPMPTLSIEEVRTCAGTLDKPSIDGICKALGAPYPLVRKLYLEAGLPLLKRGRPEVIDQEENDFIKAWNGTDTQLAIELGKLKGRTYTKEAIRQKRQKLGIELERQKWKNKALQELKDGVRPAIVAHKYGYALSTVEAWNNEL